MESCVKAGFFIRCIRGVASSSWAFAVAVALPAASFCGVCTWSGGSWTGGTWDAQPADGDDIVIDNATAGATFTVDVDSVNIGSLTFKSGGAQSRWRASALSS